MWQGLEGHAECVAKQKRSFCGAMKAEAGTLKSLVLFGELNESNLVGEHVEPNKRHPTLYFFYHY